MVLYGVMRSSSEGESEDARARFRFRECFRECFRDKLKCADSGRGRVKSGILLNWVEQFGCKYQMVKVVVRLRSSLVELNFTTFLLAKRELTFYCSQTI